MLEPRTLLLAVGTLLLLGCEPGWLPGGQAAQDAPGRPSGGLSSETEEPTQIYYQFVDEKGRVRFVPTLAAVPEEWRDRVGFVEMSAPPPMSPGEAARMRAQIRAGAMPSDRGRGAGVEIIMYSADWCGVCQKAKRYMDGQGIDYDERDIDQERFKEEMVAKAGPGGIPVFDVGGQILRGFSPDRLDQLIEQAS